MRTTLTLDDDVAARLEQLRERDGRPFKELVNTALRRGLERVEDEQPSAPGPYTRVVSLGKPRIGAIDDVSEALAVAEGDAHR